MSLPPYPSVVVPYANPHQTFTPGVLVWMKVYAGAMALLYAAVLAAGVAFIAFAEDVADADMSVEEARFMGVILMLMGAAFAAVFAAAIFLPRRPWVWIYDLVLICLGLTSMCIWPAAIPLLIFWIKPEVRAWFRDESVGPAAGAYPGF